MKKALILLILLSVSFTSLSQGLLLFNNRATAFGIDAPIYDLVVGGDLLAGTSYSAQLWVAPEANPSLFSPIGSIVSFRTGPAAGYVDVGLNSSREVTGADYGDYVYAQIRAWTAIPEHEGYEATVSLAQSNPNIRYGYSAPVYVQVSQSELLPPSPLSGLQSFAIVPAAVPEPRIMYFALFMIGLFIALYYPKRNP